MIFEHPGKSELYLSGVRLRDPSVSLYLFGFQPKERDIEANVGTEKDLGNQLKDFSKQYIFPIKRTV